MNIDADIAYFEERLKKANEHLQNMSVAKIKLEEQLLLLKEAKDKHEELRIKSLIKELGEKQWK